MNSNIFNYKYAYSLDIPKICRDDLVIIPPKLRNLLGGCSQVLICSKITSAVRFVDPISSKFVDMTANVYFQYESEMMMVPLKG